MFETMVALVGNVVSEPRVREVPSGDPVASFRLASTARRFDREAQQWVNGDRCFVTVNCWKRLAEQVPRVLFKGAGVVVSGRLRTREYDAAGQSRTVVEVLADAVGLDLARSAQRPGGADEVRAGPPPLVTGAAPHLAADG